MSKQKQINLLILTFIIAIVVVISTKAYARPFMPGGPFYKPVSEIEVKEAGEVPKALPTPQEIAENGVVGMASWYDYKIGGIEWSKIHRTCASRDLPRDSYAKITNLANGKSVECFVNDYGPEEWTGRDIDLSRYAFSQISDLGIGLIYVRIE